MNKRAEAITRILKEYAFMNQVLPRSTSDLSSMEAWLIMKLIDAEQSIETLNNELELYIAVNKNKDGLIDILEMPDDNG